MQRRPRRAGSWPITAQALVRASRALRPLGYGLLIHDAYRPWYVTKVFWDATPAASRWLVADHRAGAGARIARTAATRLRPADPRCLPAVVCDESLLGCNAGRVALARGRSPRRRWCAHRAHCGHSATAC